MLDDGAMRTVNGEMGLFIVGIITAAISGLFAIKFLLKYLSRHSLALFAYYRIALGIFVLVLNIG
jgi:undecaprenyl-diphosphatase